MYVCNINHFCIRIYSSSSIIYVPVYGSDDIEKRSDHDDLWPIRKSDLHALLSCIIMGLKSKCVFFWANYLHC